MANEEYKDLGDILIGECNDANIPVNCMLGQIDPNARDAEPKYGGWFRWSADNFMPRKNLVTEGNYLVVAPQKQTILNLVRKHVVPLYEVALSNLRESGENYFWEKK